MADITSELSTIATSIYGSEMRSAIHDAIEKVNVNGPESITVHKTSGNFSIGTEGETKFVGICNASVKLGLVVLNIHATVDDTVPYTRPSGTIIDTVGYLLCTLPDAYKPTLDSHEIPIYPTPSASARTNVPYVKVLANGEVRLYYGWDDVIDAADVDFTLITNGVYYR